MKGKKITTALVALFVTAAVALALSVHLLGLSLFVITGKSMTGEIPKGALAIDRAVPVSELAVGDVITFVPPGGSGNVTHRIIAIEPNAQGEPVFTTKGDYNESADPWHFTLDSPAQARYVFHIPYLGYGLSLFTDRLVRTVILAVVALIIGGVALSWFRKIPKDEETEEPARPAEPLYRTGEGRS